MASPQRASPVPAEPQSQPAPGLKEPHQKTYAWVCSLTDVRERGVLADTATGLASP